MTLPDTHRRRRTTGNIDESCGELREGRRLSGTRGESRFCQEIRNCFLFFLLNKYVVIALCQEKERQIKLTQMAQEFHKHLTVKQYGFRLNEKKNINNYPQWKTASD